MEHVPRDAVVEAVVAARSCNPDLVVAMGSGSELMPLKRCAPAWAPRGRKGGRRVPWWFRNGLSIQYSVFSNQRGLTGDFGELINLPPGFTEY